MNGLMLTAYNPNIYGSEDECIYPNVNIDNMPELSPEHLIGINSNSFNKSGKHHLFLEWDGLVNIPFPDSVLVTKTNKGYHAIVEGQLALDRLIDLQKSNICCPGFIEHTKLRDYACLRIIPKEGKLLKIVHKPKIMPPIQEAYYQLITRFNELPLSTMEEAIKIATELMGV